MSLPRTHVRASGWSSPFHGRASSCPFIGVAVGRNTKRGCTLRRPPELGRRLLANDADARRSVVAVLFVVSASARSSELPRRRRATPGSNTIRFVHVTPLMLSPERATLVDRLTCRVREREHVMHLALAGRPDFDRLNPLVLGDVHRDTKARYGMTPVAESGSSSIVKTASVCQSSSHGRTARLACPRRRPLHGAAVDPPGDRRFGLRQSRVVLNVPCAGSGAPRRHHARRRAA